MNSAGCPINLMHIFPKHRRRGTRNRQNHLSLRSPLKSLRTNHVTIFTVHCRRSRRLLVYRDDQARRASALRGALRRKALFRLRFAESTLLILMILCTFKAFPKGSKAFPGRGCQIKIGLKILGKGSLRSWCCFAV